MRGGFDPIILPSYGSRGKAHVLALTHAIGKQISVCW